MKRNIMLVAAASLAATASMQFDAPMPSKFYPYADQGTVSPPSRIYQRTGYKKPITWNQRKRRKLERQVPQRRQKNRQK